MKNKEKEGEMMKKSSFFISAIIVLLLATISEAKPGFFRVKEGVRGKIHVRDAPGIDSKIVGYVYTSMTWTTPIVEANGEEQDGWIKILAQNDDREIVWTNKSNRDYKLVNAAYGWVAKVFFRKINIEKEGLFQLQTADYEYYYPIRVHALPDFWDNSMFGNCVMTDMKFNISFVKPTGKVVNEWLQIYSQDGKEDKAFVFSEFFGVKIESEFVGYDKPLVFYTRGSSTVARAKPTILSKNIANYGYEEQKVFVCGEQYPWCLTDKGKWVYRGLLTENKD